MSTSDSYRIVAGLRQRKVGYREEGCRVQERCRVVRRSAPVGPAESPRRLRPRLRRYDPFGNLVGSGHHDAPRDDGSSRSFGPLAFTGQYLDPSTGLYDLRARNYDPQTGTFVQSDPLEGDPNDPYVAAYVYASDRPTALVDPSGMKALGAEAPTVPLPYAFSAVKRPGRYVSPFARTRQLVPGRIDQGVDYQGRGPITAIGDAFVVGDGGSGWPGGHYLLYRLLSGPHSGRYVYVAEAIVPRVRRGVVRAGAVVAYFGANAAPGRFPGIEIGWSSPTLNLTYAKTTTGYHEGQMTAAGKAFARFLISLGAPVGGNPGRGPTFPG